MTPSKRLDQVILDLQHRAANAASPRKNKPTMWAYYRRMAHDLAVAFAGVRPDQVHVRALELSAEAIRLAPTLDDDVDAAHAWAIGIYARRIAGASGRVSLDWLRNRAESVA